MPKIIVANPSDKAWTRKSWLLEFGADADTKILAYANSLEDALDECIDWIADNEPGLLADDLVNEAYQEAIESGLDEEEAHEQATVDTTCGGNAGNYLHSWEWQIRAENPSKRLLIEIFRSR